MNGKTGSDLRRRNTYTRFDSDVLLISTFDRTTFLNVFRLYLKPEPCPEMNYDPKR